MLTNRSVSQSEREIKMTARERIIEEAEHLIHLRGYQATSLEDIAARCKMTKANLFHHFDSKEDLGLAVLDYKINCYRKNCFEPIFENAKDSAGVVEELFAQAGRFLRGNGCKAGCFVANIALEMSDINERFREKAAAFFEEWSARIEQFFEAEQARGRLAKDFQPRAAAEAILSMYEGAIMLARSQRDPKSFERIGQIAVSFVESASRNGRVKLPTEVTHGS